MKEITKKIFIVIIGLTLCSSCVEMFELTVGFARKTSHLSPQKVEGVYFNSEGVYSNDAYTAYTEDFCIPHYTDPTFKRKLKRKIGRRNKLDSDERRATRFWNMMTLLLFVR